MALNPCNCCSLLVATSVAGIYALVAYVIAIVLETWWMIQDKSEVPAGAYLLCFGHLVTIVLSGLLIVGIALKQTQWLLVWAASVGTWLIPEAALALYMSFSHWKIESPQGVTELLFWTIRASLNIVSVTCVACQYAVWMEEKIIMRRLHILNLQEAAMRKASEHAAASKNGHNNPGFINSSNEQVNKMPLAAIQSLGNASRHASTTNLASPGAAQQLQNRPHTSSIPSNLHFISCYEKTMTRVAGLSSNEFNASMFVRQSPNNVALQRARSLLEMQIQNNNVWGYPSQLNQVSLCPGYLEQGPADNMSTQSLDRRQIKSQMRLQQHFRGPSHAQHFGTLPRTFRMQRTLSNGSLQESNHSSHTSLASQQSDQRYKDIAL
ncbi:Hypothetical predicted protein [Cloeon dipterum]|uniref:Uncharacterized protein n=1 Tax=Cloeon dipterum TaxID=197152 RepID=A0A8S1CN59_9INSE|nr:Hypothetical predicted protein [Cloeon dipterum]